MSCIEMTRSIGIPAVSSWCAAVLWIVLQVEGIGYDFIPKVLDRSGAFYCLSWFAAAWYRCGLATHASRWHACLLHAWYTADFHQPPQLNQLFHSLLAVVVDSWVKTVDKESLLMSRRLIKEEGLVRPPCRCRRWCLLRLCPLLLCGTQSASSTARVCVCLDANRALVSFAHLFLPPVQLVGGSSGSAMVAALKVAKVCCSCWAIPQMLQSVPFILLCVLRVPFLCALLPTLPRHALTEWAAFFACSWAAHSFSLSLSTCVQEMKAGQRLVVLLADSTRNYMTKFLNDVSLPILSSPWTRFWRSPFCAFCGSKRVCLWRWLELLLASALNQYM
jgi:hypothetical protein